MKKRRPKISKAERLESKKDGKLTFITTLMIGCMFLGGGILYQVTDTVIIGRNLKTLQPSVVNSYSLFIMGLTFFVISYFSFKKYKRNK